jgi:hypothetical protein
MSTTGASTTGSLQHRRACFDRAHIEMVEPDRSCTGGEVVGLTPRILKDFRAPAHVLPGIQDCYHRKGLISEEGERKLAFEVLQSYYREVADG